MQRSVFRATALVAVTALLASCTDSGPTRVPATPTTPSAPNANFSPGPCANFSNIQLLAHSVFDGGLSSVVTLLLKLGNLQKLVQAGNTAAAQAQARDIVLFIQQASTSGGLRGTPAQIQALISSVLCYAGLPPDTFVVSPSASPQVVVNSAHSAGVLLPGNSVTVPTVISITVLAPDSSPLNTKLDVYPGFVLVTKSAALTTAAVVAVCPASSVPASVLPRLRLGHQASTGFEITPAADASFLDCSTSVGQSKMPKWLKALASAVLPKPLYAAKLFAGGVGGLATEFSPFGPVDTELRFSGGVGGTATEFKVTPPSDPSGAPALPSTSPPRGAPQAAPSMTRAPGSRVNTVINGVCTLADATAGTALEPECRPGVTLKTAKGTVLQNVPVGWAIGVGAGTVAPEAPITRTCGTFGPTAATSTDVTGKAGVCWTLGVTPGTNTVLATPTAGGDAPAGVSFNPANITFTAIANQITPTGTATGGSFVFDGTGHAGSGTCSNALIPSLTYSGDGSVPKNAGVYTLTVTCGDGNQLYKTVSQTAQIEITAAPTTSTVTCPASAVYSGSPITPCTATVTGPGGLNAPVTPLTYSSNTNAGVAGASASYLGGGNYLASNGSATFQITPAPTVATVSCPTSVPFTGRPVTPCTGRVTGPGLSLALTPTYSSNLIATAFASVSYAGGGNYLPSSASTTFQISYIKYDCFASPIFSSMPPTKSWQKKGSNLPLKGTLTNSQGSGVMDAAGDLLVEDLGSDGLSAAVTVFSRTNAFKVSNGGTYSYGLDTSPNGYVSTHYYRVTANWSDGSKTIGWFYIK